MYTNDTNAVVAHNEGYLYQNYPYQYQHQYDSFSYQPQNQANPANQVIGPTGKEEAERLAQQQELMEQQKRTKEAVEQMDALLNK